MKVKRRYQILENGISFPLSGLRQETLYRFSSSWLQPGDDRHEGQETMSNEPGTPETQAAFLSIDNSQILLVNYKVSLKSGTSDSLSKGLTDKWN